MTCFQRQFGATIWFLQFSSFWWRVFLQAELVACQNCFYSLFLTLLLLFFFSIRVFFHGHWQLPGQQGEGGPSYSTLPLPRAHEHSDIYLQLCTWDDYHLVFTAISHEKPVDWNSHRLSSLYLQANQKPKLYTTLVPETTHYLFLSNFCVTICISPSSTKVFLQLEHHIKLLIDWQNW